MVLEPGEWFVLRPRLGVGGIGGVLAGSPWFWVEVWRIGEVYRVYVSGRFGSSLRRVASLEKASPPSLGPEMYVAELRQDAERFFEPLHAEGIVDVLDWLRPGMVVQVVGWVDPKARRVLEGEARRLRRLPGDSPGSKMLAEVLDGMLGYDPKDRYRLERYRRDPALEEERRRLSQTARSRAAQPVTIVRFRVYGPERDPVVEAAEFAASRFSRPLHVWAPRVGRGRVVTRTGRRAPGPAGFLSGPDRRLLWLTRDDVETVIPLPDPGLFPAEFSRGVLLPSIVPPRRDIQLGVLVDGREFRVDVEDLYRHAYVIGKTGAGKSTLLLNLALRLWATGKATVVVVDPHGDLARDIVEAVPSLERVYYLDAGRRDFAVNPLDLPRLGDSELARSIAVDNTVAVLEKVLRLPETAVNVKFIVKTLLHAMYERGGSPTFEDLYRAIVGLRAGTLDLDVDDPEWGVQLELLRKLPEQSIASSLVRLQPFHTHPLLRELTRSTTLDLDRLVRERALVAVSVPKALGEEFSELLTSVILMKLWFYVLERALRGEPRDPVFVIVDEFQNVSGLPILETILSEARKYGLHIIAAHQHLKQLPPELLQSLLANTALKAVFSVEGSDVDRLAKIDRGFAREIAEVLPGLTVGQALVRLQARPGEEPWPPVVVRTDPPPRKLRTLEEALARLPRFTPPPEPERFSPEELLNPVLSLLPRERLSPEELLVLYRVWRASKGGRGVVEWTRVLAGLGLRRQRAEEARDSLAARGLIEAYKEGNRWLVRYVRGLFSGLKTVAPSREGRRIAARALLYYLEHGYYVSVARQGGPAAPDLVAIPYDRAQLRLRYSEALAVEVESCNEVETHPEQVSRNLVKNWELIRKGTIRRVEFWTASECTQKLQAILEQAAKENQIPAEAYQVHTVALEKPKPSRKGPPEQPPEPEPDQGPQSEPEDTVTIQIQGHTIQLTRTQYQQYKKLILKGWKPTITQNGQIKLTGPKGQTHTINPKTPNPDKP